MGRGRESGRPGGIYNTLVESGAADPRFPKWDSWQMGASFADIIKNGVDALLWALIRIGIEETRNEDLAELCESRGFIVRLPRRSDDPSPRSGAQDAPLS